MTAYDEVKDPRLHYLKEFQSKRLQKTYADFTEQPLYKPTCFFFFHRLYSTEDTTDRDKAFKRIYHLVQRFLGGDVAKSMQKLIELQDLTLALDKKLIDLLEAGNHPIEFDMACYERLYKESDNYNDRVRQIELLEFTLRTVHRISHRFGIRFVLSSLRKACLLFGDTRMVDFLQDGYRAFENLKDIEPLAIAIRERETQRLNRIFGLDPAPQEN